MEVKNHHRIKRWGLREITNLHKRRVAGERTADLATEIGVSTFALRKAFHDWGFRMPSIAPAIEVLQDSAEQFMSGGDLYEIADELHLSYQQLYHMMWERGLLKRKTKLWSDEELQAIRAQFNSGVSASYLAERYRITRHMVYYLLKRTKTPRRRQYTQWSDDLAREIKKSLEEGATWDDVAEPLELTPESVRMALKRRGLLPQREGWSERKMRQSQSRLRKGESWIAVARSLGCSSRTLKNKLKQFGFMP
jgi:AraC-like DNA-binding protein